jgi:hypothetical protein
MIDAHGLAELANFVALRPLRGELAELHFGKVASYGLLDEGLLYALPSSSDRRGKRNGGGAEVAGGSSSRHWHDSFYIYIAHES